jgi:cellulose biosynthesis protein BcsQ
MTVPILAFFNNKGGVGKTSLVYHMAWMYADMGRTVVAVDLDPQANLTAAFLDEDRIEELWSDDWEPQRTIYGAMSPLMRGVGDIETPERQQLAPRLHLIAGNLALSNYEDDLSREWPLCLERKERAFRVTTAFWRAVQRASEEIAADVALLDLGPNLGAINRAALIASDHVVVPVAPDLFSLQGLRNLGPTLRLWREGWNERVAKNPERTLSLPTGTINPAGYVVLQHVVRLDRPAKAFDRWMARIPHVYATAVLAGTTSATHPDNDPNCLGIVKRYGSLMPLSQEARKPIFRLKASDGAIGSHAKAAIDARRDFEALARRIADASWMHF